MSKVKEPKDYQADCSNRGKGGSYVIKNGKRVLQECTQQKKSAAEVQAQAQPQDGGE